MRFLISIIVILIAIAISIIYFLQPKVISGCNIPVKVIDGDTFYLMDKKIRIYGIDTPELEKQKKWVLEKIGTKNESCLRYYAFLAKEKLREYLTKYCIKIEIVGKDIYNRDLAKVYVCANKSNCFDLGRKFVKEGLALSFGKAYIMEEKFAKEKHLGIWSCK